MLPALHQRPCPVCASTAMRGVFMHQRIDPTRLDGYSYASRKTPEHMTLRLVRCHECDVVYAPTVPDADWLAQAYQRAEFDTREEAGCAAATYAAALAPHVARMQRRGAALEVGAGTGAFLPHLLGFGFAPVIGIEPSLAAIAAADPPARQMIREGVFEPNAFEPGTLGMFCSFQTLEHVDSPRMLVQGAFRLLDAGGLIALVTHNYTALLNRLLGRWSPIIDIEHLQLFHPRSLRVLLAGAGFDAIRSVPLKNVYPARYWARLLPLPAIAKGGVNAGLKGLGLAGVNIGARVGNLLTVAWKPAEADLAR